MDGKALLSCVLPNLPTENKAPTEGKTKYTRPECPELVAICSQIEAIWKEAPLCSDTLPLVWLQSCGYGTQIDSKKIGTGLYEVTVSSNPNLGADEWSYTLKARSLAKAQYEKLRKLQMEEDYAAEKYAFRCRRDRDHRNLSRPSLSHSILCSLSALAR